MNEDFKQVDDDTIEKLTPDKYWVLQTSSVEGRYIATQLVNSHFKDMKPESEDVVVGWRPDGTLIYWLRKTKLPVEALSVVTGYRVEALREAKLIKLKVKVDPTLPQPTVDYWGTA